MPVLSKVPERTVAIRLNTHMSKHHLCDTLQLAYKTSHSNETAVIRVQNDLLLSLDKRKVASIILLDLSAAFDTIDHDILLTRMRNLL